MSVRQVAFSEIFNGEVNYGPQAVVNIPLAALVERHGLRVETGEDGLDRFEVVPMELSVRFVDGGVGRLPFALWRHAGNPPGTFAIHTPIQMEGRFPLALVLRELRIPRAAILWQASPHEAAA